MHEINFEKTGGQFGSKRVLATFELVPLENGRIAVWDRRGNYHSAIAYVGSVEEAVKMFKRQDDYRTMPL